MGRTLTSNRNKERIEKKEEKQDEKIDRKDQMILETRKNQYKLIKKLLLE